MLISLNASLGVFDIEIKLRQLLQNLFIDWDSVIANNYSTIQRNVINLLTPLMSKYLLNSISFGRINIEYLFQKIFE